MILCSFTKCKYTKLNIFIAICCKLPAWMCMKTIMEARNAWPRHSTYKNTQHILQELLVEFSAHSCSKQHYFKRVQFLIFVGKLTERITHLACGIWYCSFNAFTSPPWRLLSENEVIWRLVLATTLVGPYLLKRKRSVKWKENDTIWIRSTTRTKMITQTTAWLNTNQRFSARF